SIQKLLIGSTVYDTDKNFTSGTATWFTTAEGNAMGLAEGKYVMLVAGSKFAEVDVTYESNAADNGSYGYKVDFKSATPAALVNGDKTIANVVLLPAGQVAFDATAA